MGENLDRSIAVCEMSSGEVAEVTGVKVASTSPSNSNVALNADAPHPAHATCNFPAITKREPSVSTKCTSSTIGWLVGAAVPPF